ncbi:MAG: MBL fold metallo-hydrolase RNA specificity domain-containing protein [Phycisphaerales bacterium]
MYITFHGAAREVTGSCYLIEAMGHRVLFDCGLFQGGPEASDKNRGRFSFDPASLDAVVLSHAHLDHSGLLPKLVRDGYRGPIFATGATIELAAILLRDSAYLHEMDAERRSRWNRRKGRPPVQPLYRSEDAERVLPLFKRINYYDRDEILDGISLRFLDAGHILGSAIAEFVFDGGHSREVTLVMSGDIGPNGAPFLRDPDRLEYADFIVMESTYGDRNHRSREETVKELREILVDARETNGPVLIPAFAVGRSQELIYHLNEMYHDGTLPFDAVYLDSPMAIQVTELYKRFRYLFDEPTRAAIKLGEAPCDFPALRLSRTAQDSMSLNERRGAMIVIAAAGMCTGGRILHHLKHHLWRPETHVVFVGFQAYGTPGRAIVDGAAEVRLHGEEIAVAAKVHTLGGFSAHAGQQELLAWREAFQSGARTTALVHGESRAMGALTKELQRRGLGTPLRPDRGERVALVSDR